MINPFLLDVGFNNKTVKISNDDNDIFFRVSDVTYKRSYAEEDTYTIEGTVVTEASAYILHDLDSANFISKCFNTQPPASKPHKSIPEIKNVIYNDPATIVFWSDGTKTVVKCGEGDDYDPEKGLAMAISKKALGNQGNYYNAFTKWLPEEECDLASVLEAFQRLAKAFRTGGDK